MTDDNVTEGSITDSRLSIAGADESRGAAVAWRMSMMLLLCVATALGAQVKIPVPGTPVPMTLQPVAVLLAGFALSPRYAAGAMGLYLAVGTLYNPFFAPGSLGLAGETGGYLVGFFAAAVTISLLKGGRNASFLRLYLAGAAGLAVLFTLGIAWRAGYIGIAGAMHQGLVPFVVKDFVQLGVVVALVRVLRTGGRREASE